MAISCTHYRPRTPEKTVLYQVVKTHLEAFKAHVTDRGRHLPAYVEKEFEAYLSCGRHEEGFIRIKCEDCDFQRLLPFSCKRRGFCPSCCGRRMNETELSLVDHVFPHENTRQWVLSLPIPIRFYCARNRELINMLMGICHQTICQLIKRKLKAIGIRKSMPGGVLFIQRLGGAVNLNIHAHAIFLDGGYETVDEGSAPKFHSISDHFTQDDVAWTVRKIAERSIKRLQRLGILDDEGYSKNQDEVDGIGLCDVASVKNMIAYGERAGKKVRRLYLKIDPTADVTSPGHLTAELHGFNLKSDRVVKGHQRWKLARLVRYVARPPVANDRLTLSDDGGTVTYTMKRPWSDGTSKIVLSGVEMLEKLSAAVPPPRGHLVRYVGVLAPNSKLRSQVVPTPKPKARDKDGKLKSLATAKPRWADLMKRAFGFDLTRCLACGGKVKVVAVIANARLAAAILQRCAGPPAAISAGHAAERASDITFN